MRRVRENYDILIAYYSETRPMIAHIISSLELSNNSLFWFCALLGTFLFILRILMGFVDSSLVDADLDTGSFDTEHGHDSFFSFKVLTLHSLSGFLLMFGWVGLACTLQLGFSYFSSLLLASACGVGMAIFTTYIIKGALLLESSGSTFSTLKTIGLTGYVYQQITADEQGKIHVIVDNISRELLAQSHEKKDIESFALVKIVAALDEETVEVIEITEDML